MRHTWFGIAAAALLTAAPALEAQNVSVSLRLGDGPVRVSGYYASRPQYVIPQHFYCEPDGAFLYCWDGRARRIAHPVVYVYPANPRFVVVHRQYRGARGERGARGARHWRQAATRVNARWRAAHRLPRSDVRVVLGWER